METQRDTQPVEAVLDIRLATLRQIYARTAAKHKERQNIVNLRNRMNRPESVPTTKELREFFG